MDASDLPDESETRFRRIAGLAQIVMGYAALPIGTGCDANAIRVVMIGLAMGLQAPGIAPSGDMGIGIEWETD